MDQPGAAAGWASAAVSAREAAGAQAPAHPGGVADDAEVHDATTGARKSQEESAKPAGDAAAPGTVEAAPKKPRPILKPLVQLLPPFCSPPPCLLLSCLAQLTSFPSRRMFPPPFILRLQRSGS